MTRITAIEYYLPAKKNYNDPNHKLTKKLVFHRDILQKKMKQLQT